MSLGLALLGCATRPPTPDRTLDLGAAPARMRYDNGLELVIAPDDAAELVAVDLRFAAGARDEAADRSGLAHLAEHVALELAPSGTPLSAILADFSLGHDAFTGLDATHFQILTLPGDVERAFHVLAELLAGDCGTLTAELLERERAVVQGERVRRDAAFQRDERDVLAALVYPQGHPYGGSVGGTASGLASISRQDVCDFLRSGHDPARAAVIVTGAVEVDTIRGFADAALELVPTRSPAPRAAVPPLSGEARRSATAPSTNHALALAFPTPPRSSADAAAIRVLARVTAEIVAELPKTAREIKSVRVVEVGGDEAPALVLLAEYRDPAHKGRVEQALWRLVERIATASSFGVFDPIQRQRLRIEIVGSLETLATRAHVLGESLAARREPGLVRGEITRLDGLDAEVIRAAAAWTFRRSHAVTIDLAPSPGEMLPAAAQLRLPRDVHGDGRDFPSWPSRRSSAVRVRHLDNGLRVVLAPSSAMPILEARLILHAGHDDAPKGSPLAALFAAQLAEAPEIPPVLRARELFELAGGSIAVEVDRSSTVFVARGLSIYLDYLLGGLASYVREGVYADDTLTALRARHDAASEALTSVRRARNRLIRTLIGGERRCVDLLEGRALAREAFRPAELREFRAGHYRARNATLLLTGRFDAELALAHAQAAFGAPGAPYWNARATAARPPASAAPTSAPWLARGGPHLTTVAVAGSDQAHLSLGLVMPAALAEDLAQATIVRELVDSAVEAVQARLSVEVERLCDVDLLWISGDIEAGGAAEVAARLHRSLASLRAGDDFAARFEGARHAAARELVARASDSRAVAERLQRVAKRRELAGLERSPVQQVAEASPDRVRQALVETLDPAVALVLCVGQRAAAERACAGLQQSW